MDRTHKTFEEWLAVGRVVRKGESATRWWVADEGTQYLSLFGEEQTIPLTEGSIVDSKPTLDLKGVKGKRVRYRYENGRMSVWIGSHQDMKELLQRSGYRFRPHPVMRWQKDVSEAQRLAFEKAAEKRGYTVVWENESL